MPQQSSFVSRAGARLTRGSRALIETTRRLERAEKQLARCEETVAEQRRRIEHLSGRDDLGYLFVLTYGRSGSTLLQGILNSLPGYLIRGENRQVMRNLHDFHRAAAAERKKQRRQRRRAGLPATGSSPQNAFYGMAEFPLRTSLTATRTLALATLLRPEPDTRVTGFKEIRWTHDDVAEYVAWLREVFPGARFVVNTRNLEDVARSKWWAEREDALPHLQAVEQRLLDLAADLGDDAFRVHYDEYVADPTTLRPLFDWLGEPWDDARLRHVLDVPHSY